MRSIHIPVLLQEVVSGLIPEQFDKNNPAYLDGTLGGASHAKAIAERLKGQLTIVGMDRDPEAIERAKNTLKDASEHLILVNEDYRHLDTVLKDNSLASTDLILFDLGISSDELENSGRGFTFQKDEPLLMTLGDPAKYQFTAKDIVNNWEEDVIANIIFGYGEDRFARRIARAIINYRAKAKIETSGELSELVKSAVPAFYRRSKIHPATKTFQALRIAVNDELNALREGLEKGFNHLVSHGRIGVISFHSLEDRIVKEFFRERGADGSKILTKKPITATNEEIASNPRSRSAKLRILEKA